MSTLGQVALVPIPAAGVPANGGFTGSSNEYWAYVATQQQQTENIQRAQKAEKARIMLRKRQRLFAWFSFMISGGELAYFIVGLYLVKFKFADLVENPLLGPGSDGIIRMGGTYTQRIIQDHQYWRLLSSLFYNAGFIHWGANVGMIWAFGHLLVREISPWTIMLIFLGAGLAGLMFSVNVGASFATAGASIPAFALAGAATCMLIYHWRRYTCHWASILMVGFIVGSNAFIGATPFVDNSGNTAGFVFGAVLCLGFMMVRRQESKTKGGEVVLYGTAVAAVAIILAAIVGGLAGLQLNTPIAGCCNPWVCTPSAWWDCDASRIWPNTCTLTSYSNSSSILTCPRGSTISVSIGVDAGTEAIQDLCESLCGASTNTVSSGGESSSMSIRS